MNYSNQVKLNPPLRESFSLDGEWSFSPCTSPLPPSEVPSRASWDANPLHIPVVPGWDERWGSGGAGFLRRAFVLRPLNGQRAWVRFEAIGGETIFFLNGKRIYASSESLLAVEFDISDHTNRLDNELIVWCGPHPSLPTCPKPQTQSRGPWRPSSLVYAPSISIPDAAVRTSVRREQVEVDISLENRTMASVQAELHLSILDGETIVKEVAQQSVELSAGVMTTLRFRMNWPGARHWSPQDPYCYELEACLERAGQTLDLRKTRFGFREVWQERGAWLLNGQTLNIQNSTDLATDPASPRGCFQHMRTAGIDLVYINGIPPITEVLNAADETGMLLVGGYTAGLNPLRQQDHLTALIRRDRSHPSLLAWRLDASGEQKALFYAMDPTRPLFGPASPIFLQSNLKQGIDTLP